jgi:hypothetical protein
VCAAGVTCPAIVVNPTSLPAALLGTPYNQIVSASGGTAPYSFAVSAGALPGGLTLNAATGAISGIPNASGNFAFTITATDINNCPGSRGYSLQLGAAGGGATPVPTLSMWSILLLAALLVGFGIYRTQRRSVPAAVRNRQQQ